MPNISNKEGKLQLSYQSKPISDMNSKIIFNI